jgi:uncharacterized cupredoxin-like copper-binding protein
MLKTKCFRGLPAALAACGLIASAAPALADVGHDNAAKTGAPGKAADVARTVTVDMYDSYYEPKSISVREGETIRFVVRNAGELLHEFSIATPAMHEAHRPEMMAMMESGMLEADRVNHGAAGAMHGGKGPMMHDDPNSILLEPGESGEIAWRFPKQGVLEFACNIPGHYEAGMVGKIKLTH